MIFFVVEGLIVWSVIRYRRKPGDDELPPQTHGNNLAEVTWTLVPTIIVIFLFVVSWQTLNSVEATSSQPNLKVRAVGGQFQWSFDYLPADAQADTKALFTVNAPEGPDGGLTLPAGQTTHLYLHSPDVIHAFYVPQFLFKRDVVPGITNQFDLDIPASDAGQTYRGQCAELCGVGHRIMPFEVHALAPADFEAWHAEADRGRQRDPAAGSVGPGRRADDPAGREEREVRPVDADRARRPGSRSTTTTRTRAPRTTSSSSTAAGRRSTAVPVVTGPKAEDFPVPPIPAGTYKFECSIHPQLMFGTLTVQ